MDVRAEKLMHDSSQDGLKVGSAITVEDLIKRKHAALRSLVSIIAANNEKSPIEIVEVGSWLGESAINWAAAINEFNAGVGRIICIDPWLPYDGGMGIAQGIPEEMNRLLESGEAINLFKANIYKAGIQGMIEINRAKSDDALVKLAGLKFDLLFIDGDHSYRQVKADIENASVLVRDGGIMCGDDLEVLFTECNQVIALKWAEIGAEYVFEPTTGIFFHPGVTVAVFDAFDEVSRHGVVWAVRKSGDCWLPVRFG